MQADKRPRTQTGYSLVIHQILDYLYTCKTFFKMPNSVELQREIECQCSVCVNDSSCFFYSMLYCYWLTLFIMYIVVLQIKLPLTLQGCQMASMMMMIMLTHYFYHSTIMSFHQIRSRESTKYKTVIHCSVRV